ncbi:MAG: ribosome biogenesis GTP-binding protein YihA/YsxC [Candidatus Sericytochromatia bacterium]
MKINSSEFVTSAVNKKGYPQNKLSEIAIVGRSNVGKSSLINYILNRKKLAKVSATPGKTRQINYFIINKSFYLVDLPGYGYAKVSFEEQEKWQKFIEEYLIENKNLKLLLQLIDIRHELKDSDKMMIDFLNNNNIPHVIVLTKSDKLNSSELSKQKSYFLNLLKDNEIIISSSEKGSGKEQILSTIANYLDS